MKVPENLFYFEDRMQWRNWLESHFLSAKEAWLVYPNKSTGKPRIAYNDAVEEALCFGWIDSIVRKVDSSHHSQRFTPRNDKSTYSQPNIERLKWLYKHGMIHTTVLPRVVELIEKEYIFPEDILNQLRRDPEVWLNFNRFPDGYKRIRVAYLDASRGRPEDFQKRLKNFIDNTRHNRMIKGFGGIEKYYTS